MVSFSTWRWSRSPGAIWRYAWKDFFADHLKRPILLLAGSGGLIAALNFGGWPSANFIAGRIDFLFAEWESARGQSKAAEASIRAALTHSRSDASTWRLAALISNSENSAATAYCWRKADLLDPGSLSTQLSLAESALRSGQLDLATEALAEVTEDKRTSEGFLFVAARLADARGEDKEADRCFGALEKLQPQSWSARLALASWRTHSRDCAEMRRGMDDLVALLKNPDMSGTALRSLIQASMATGDKVQALSWSDRLIHSGYMVWSDQLQRLDLLSDGDRDRALGELMSKGREPSKIVATVDWLIAHRAAEMALIWIREEPEEIQDDPGIGGARARCLATLGLWEHLRDIQQADFWPGHEPARLMYLSDALAHLGDEAGARSAWARAVFSCQSYGDFVGLKNQSEVRLKDLSRDSFWSDARTLILTHMVAAYPGEMDLARAFLEDAERRRDSVRVEYAWQRLASMDPGDIEAAAQWNRLSLLRGVRIFEAIRAITQLRRDNPGNASVLTAAAFALYRQGRFREAEEALGELNEDGMKVPERAVYIGSILAVIGPAERANSYLAVALREPELLPEERALAAKSQMLLAYRARMDEVLGLASRLDSPKPRVESDGDFSAPFFAVMRSVEILSKAGSGDANAARMLTQVKVTRLDVAEEQAYLGAVLYLAGKIDEARPYLALDADLPEETASALSHRALDAWWLWYGQTADRPLAAFGLFAVYSRLEETEMDPGFWQQDADRELKLIRSCLLRGEAVEAASEQLTALLRHLPFSSRTEALSALVAFRHGQFRTAQRCLEELPAQDLKCPENALYYAAVLKASGRKVEAVPYFRLAKGSSLSTEESLFASETLASP